MGDDVGSQEFGDSKLAVHQPTEHTSVRRRPESIRVNPASEPIILVAYDPRWRELFDTLANQARAALGSLVVTIEHVGSTAVPGLVAKPIIDLDVVVPSASDSPLAVTRLAATGYVHQGDLGIAGREAFRSPPDKPAHHLYVCPLDSVELHRHLRFRDYLWSHPATAAAYADLKQSLASRFRQDREAYTNGKTAIVKHVLKCAGA